MRRSSGNALTKRRTLSKRNTRPSIANSDEIGSNESTISEKSKIFQPSLKYCQGLGESATIFIMASTIKSPNIIVWPVLKIDSMVGVIKLGKASKPIIAAVTKIKPMMMRSNKAEAANCLIMFIFKNRSCSSTVYLYKRYSSRKSFTRLLNIRLNPYFSSQSLCH